MATERKHTRTANIGHLRHKPREVYWLRGDNGQDNFALRREFEAISKSHNDLVDELAAMLNGQASSGIAIRTYRSSSGGAAGGSSGGEDDIVTRDEKVAITSGDMAGFLQEKIAAGDGIAIEPSLGPAGQILVVRLDMDLRQYSFAFEGREVTIYHPFTNQLYDFTLDKPLSDGSLGPLTYETYKKQQNRLWIRFARDEFGVCTLTGRLGAVQVG